MKQVTPADKNFYISVTAIRDMGFFLNESQFVADKQARVEFKHVTSFNIESNIVVFNLECTFYYSDVERTPENNLVLINVQNIFTVLNLKEYISDKNLLVLPQIGFLTIVGLSVSHCRALLASHTAGTMYQQTILPIINPADMTKSFFPQAFNKPNEAQVK